MHRLRNPALHFYTYEWKYWVLWYTHIKFIRPSNFSQHLSQYAQCIKPHFVTLLLIVFVKLKKITYTYMAGIKMVLYIIVILMYIPIIINEIDIILHAHGIWISFFMQYLSLFLFFILFHFTIFLCISFFFLLICNGFLYIMGTMCFNINEV